MQRSCCGWYQSACAGVPCWHRSAVTRCVTCACLARPQEASSGQGMLLAGVSPSASLKRDKLLQRNAILRRTGFIEEGGPPLLPGACA